jgi:hypothetical protein
MAAPSAVFTIARDCEELNVFGSPTGRTSHAEHGERLPRSPLGFTWRRIKREGC